MSNTVGSFSVACAAQLRRCSKGFDGWQPSGRSSSPILGCVHALVNQRPRRVTSAAHPVPQVPHSVVLDEHISIIEQVPRVNRAEVPPAGTEHDRHHVHGDLVDQAERERLAADNAGAEPSATMRSPARRFASSTAEGMSSKNGTSASGCQPSGFGPVRHDEEMFARGAPRSRPVHRRRARPSSDRLAAIGRILGPARPPRGRVRATPRPSPVVPSLHPTRCQAIGQKLEHRRGPSGDGLGASPEALDVTGRRRGLGVTNRVLEALVPVREQAGDRATTCTHATCSSG
jgi:hypothetical protein